MQLLLLLAALAAAGPAPGPADDAAYLAGLQARARDRGLARERGWLRLGHWRPGLLGGLTSEVAGAEFFLAPGGRGDPDAELQATLAGFFAPEPADEKVMHPQCRFPARLSFLARELGLDPARLPRRQCPQLDEWWSRTRAAGVTLVFSSYYLNNPASAFGHTFLRLDRRLLAAPGERLELADQGVDYAATVDTGNAVLYAAKGLLGLFKGEWSARPYFYKVREYADFESRDLWEYELELPPATVAFLVAHLWELGATWFRYYYLTQNCSYQILTALEAAAPGLDLVSHVGPVVIPADTVKALHLNPGLVREVRYRPSARTQLDRRVAALDGPALEAVLALAEHPAAPLPEAATPETRAATLDAALDLYDVRHAREIVRGEVAAVDRRQELLLRRATVPVVSPPLQVEPPAGGGPERGHDSARLELGGGGSRADGPVALLGWRLALHDLADPPAGFAPGSQLEFLKLRLRAGGRHGGTLRLDEAGLASVATYTSLDRLDPRISFRARLGAARIRDGGCRACVAGRAEAGGGATFGAGPLLLGLVLDASLEAAPDLAGLGGSGFRPGAGPGAVLRLAGARASMVAEASWRHYPRARPDAGWELSAQARLHLGRVSLFAEGRKLPGDAEALAGLQLFH